jgi:PBSX family phage terminase large subunit
MIQLTEAQEQIAADLHRFRVVCCGRRFGKTTLAILEMVAKAVSRSDVSICYIAPTYQQARDIAWQELKRVCRPVTKTVNESRLEITLKAKGGGESRILLRGWESIETLRGQKFFFMVIDEVAMMRNFELHWQEVLRPTLTDLKGEVLFISTPKGFNHFYDLFNRQLSDPDYKSFQFASYANTFLDPAELDKAREEVTEDRFAQEYMADFRKTEGLVYKEFDRFHHVHADHPRPETIIERLVGIDWGYTNPAGILLIEKDYDSKFWVREEYYKTKKTTAEIIEYASSLRANAYYPDPAEPDRIEELRRAGLYVKEVNKDVVAGIDHVRNLFKNNRVSIHGSCLNLIHELETYSYQEKKPDKNSPETPIKENDHLADSLRYVLFMQGTKSRRAVHQFIPKRFRK